VNCLGDEQHVSQVYQGRHRHHGPGHCRQGLRGARQGTGTRFQCSVTVPELFIPDLDIQLRRLP
jgi:hypothetical protein